MFSNDLELKLNNGKTYLIVDMSNLLYKAFYAREYTGRSARYDERMELEDDTDTFGLAHHAALTTLNKYYKLHKPDKVVATFDRKSWRKDYTESEACVSKKPYKGHRRKNMSKTDKERYYDFLNHVQEFEEILRTHTSIICLGQDKLEADDLIAGFVQNNPDDTHIIVSADGDMLQLLKHENVSIIDPATGKEKTLEDWEFDAKYFMFLKCFRGDSGDNVQSAYPRLRETKIKDAYTDEFKRLNLMDHVWQDQNKVQYKVGDLFKENKLLMDLECQPDNIRQLINETIEHGVNNTGQFNYFKFLNFCGKYSLSKIAGSVEQYMALLSK